MAKRRYHPEFPTDLRTAIRHFDLISTALGERFRNTMREKLAFIAENPEAYAKLSGEIRGARLPRFPYVILYTWERDRVYFISLVLGSSDRKTWFDRLK